MGVGVCVGVRVCVGVGVMVGVFVGPAGVGVEVGTLIVAVGGCSVTGVTAAPEKTYGTFVVSGTRSTTGGAPR